MARRKKPSLIIVLVIALILTSLFSSLALTGGEQDKEQVIKDPAVVLTYENGVDFKDFTFNK